MFATVRLTFERAKFVDCVLPRHIALGLDTGNFGLASVASLPTSKRYIYLQASSEVSCVVILHFSCAHREWERLMADVLP